MIAAVLIAAPLGLLALERLGPRAPREAASEARLATSTGTPGGVSGTSTRAIAVPSAATPRARRLRSSFRSSPKKKAGKIASRPNAFGSPSLSPQIAPTAVPPTQVT